MINEKNNIENFIGTKHEQTFEVLGYVSNYYRLGYVSNYSRFTLVRMGIHRTTSTYQN